MNRSALPDVAAAHAKRIETAAVDAAPARAPLRRLVTGRLQGLGIRWRFRIVVLSFGLPFLAYILWSAAQEQRRETELVRMIARDDAVLIAARFHDHLDQIEHLLGSVSQAVAPSFDDAAASKALVLSLRNHLPRSVENIGVWRLDGSNLASLDSRSTTRAVNVADRRYFREAVARREFTFEGPIRSRASGGDIIQFARPVFAADATMIGVVSMSLRTSLLIGQLDPTGRIVDEALVTILNSTGTIVTRSVDAERYSGKQIPRLAALSEAFDQRSGAREEVGMDGVRRLAGYAIVDNWPWIVMVGRPFEQAIAPIGMRLIERIVVGLAIFGVALLAAGRIASWTIRPLLALTSDTERLRQGDMSHRSSVIAGGEIGTLAANINSMAAAIEERERELAASRARMHAITDNIPQQVVYLDREERYRFVNAYCGPFPYMDPAAMLGKTIREVRGELIYTGIAPSLHRALAGEADAAECTTVVEGRAVHYHVSYVPDSDANGVVIGVYGFAHDITERKTAELLLQMSEKRLVTITDNVPAMICYVDAARCYRFANRAFERWYERPVADILGKPFDHLMTPEMAAQFQYYYLRGMRGETIEYEVEVQTRDSGPRWLKSTLVPDVDEVDGRVRGVYGMMHNVTKSKEAEQRLTRLAQHDSLTGLANRHQFNETFNRALDDRHGEGRLALIFLDIDHFKQVNDRYGHGSGDLLLKELAQRLTDCVRPTDTVARLAGDEFVVLLEGMHSDEEPQFIARKIIASIEKSFRLDDHLARVTASIGIAMRERPDESASELLKRADEALYEAKRAGRNTFRMAS